VEKAAASAGLMRSVPGRRLVNVDDLPDTVPSNENPSLVVAPDGRSLRGCPGNEQRVAANGAIAVELFPVVRQIESLAGLLLASLGTLSAALPALPEGSSDVPSGIPSGMLGAMRGAIVGVSGRADSVIRKSWKPRPSMRWGVTYHSW
jgi:hypothetical protein